MAPARRRRSTLLAAFGAALLLAVPLMAQDQPAPQVPWKDSFFPYLTSSSNDFPMIALKYVYFRPADYFARVANAAIFGVDVGVSFNGSRRAIVRFDAPLLWPGWRFSAAAAAVRQSQFGFYGLGNDTPYDKTLVTDTSKYYYRAHRTRYLTRAELTRRIVGRLSASLMGGIERSRLSSPAGPSVFAQTIGTQVDETDAIGRLALVFDTRDKEYNPQKGLFVEGSVLRGSGGDGYTRITAIARGYVSIREGTVLAARLAGSGIDGSPPLSARFDLPSWENTQSILGGAATNRGLAYERFAGSGVLIGSAEIRHNILDAGDFGAITAIGFVDAGRVFEGEPFKLTTDGLKVGGGLGLGIRVLRSSIFALNFAGGPEGFQFTIGTGWAF
jgi:outer membrane protein assembly factor BamA